MNFRAAPGRRITWHKTSIGSGFSNFLFIDREYYSHPVLRRIFSLARKHNYESVLIEEILEKDCSLLAEENAALSVRRKSYQGSIVHRLSFWRCLPEQVCNSRDFIGYAIFKSDRFDGQQVPDSHIYECVLPPARLISENNFIHCRRSYKVQVEGTEQIVSGVLYAQQNGLTFVCAHVALRSALASLLPEGDISYSLMNSIAGVDHTNRLVGDGIGGLGPEDMEKILRHVGIHQEKIVHEPDKGLDLPTEFQRDLYGFIESGDPALVGFKLDDPNPGPQGSPRHIVPVIGHTFNDDAWVPDAQRSYFGNQLSYFSSESWLSSYVLHDDNFGPYYCLPRHFLKKDNFRLILGMRRHETSFSAVEAEAVGIAFLRAIAAKRPRVGQDWYDRFSIYASSNLLVLRSLLVEKGPYLKHLKEIRSWEGIPFEESSIANLENRIPERFWMIEVSAQELFTVSRRKFGEVILSCDIPLPKPLDISLLVAARLPGQLLISNPGQLQFSPSNLQGHTSIFESSPNF